MRNLLSFDWVAVLPVVAALCFVAFGTWFSIARWRSGSASWMLPASLAVLFLAFTLVAVFKEGALNFWPEHVRNLWGNQIWFDLLIAAGLAFIGLVEKARALGMRPLPWFALVVATGSIGLLAFSARILFLQVKNK
jgi:hypothetical protein